MTMDSLAWHRQTTQSLPYISSLSSLLLFRRRRCFRGLLDFLVMFSVWCAQRHNSTMRLLVQYTRYICMLIDHRSYYTQICEPKWQSSCEAKNDRNECQWRRSNDICSVLRVCIPTCLALCMLCFCYGLLKPTKITKPMLSLWMYYYNAHTSKNIQNNMYTLMILSVLRVLWGIIDGFLDDKLMKSK